MRPCDGLVGVPYRAHVQITMCCSDVPLHNYLRGALWVLGVIS